MMMQPTLQGSYSSQKDFGGPITMICSIISYASAPQTFNQFPTFLGLHLHSYGVKRRVLSLLASLGLIPSYYTIMSRALELTEYAKV